MISIKDQDMGLIFYYTIIMGMFDYIVYKLRFSPYYDHSARISRLFLF